MPNWCENELTVHGQEADVAQFKEKAIGKSPWGGAEEIVLNFHSLMPIPAEVIAAGYHRRGYFWELENWGCKWGASDAELANEWEGYLVYRFLTPWSPPIAFLEKLARQWPALTFLIDYEETCS